MPHHYCTSNVTCYGQSMCSRSFDHALNKRLKVHCASIYILALLPITRCSSTCTFEHFPVAAGLRRESHYCSQLCLSLDITPSASPTGIYCSTSPILVLPALCLIFDLVGFRAPGGPYTSTTWPPLLLPALPSLRLGWLWSSRLRMFFDSGSFAAPSIR
jgi:hypothetical protein